MTYRNVILRRHVHILSRFVIVFNISSATPPENGSGDSAFPDRKTGGVRGALCPSQRVFGRLFRFRPRHSAPDPPPRERSGRSEEFVADRDRGSTPEKERHPIAVDGGQTEK
ncbi:hypothetical protein [Lyngbya sp. CCY1209]|uniref:hypothetical protein n=1 Tax=Lyngbya sp. CCY1209 TaxID=2886103 RepID=UPI002D1FD072|nr:hypothetical protein [Lyngbya sp. CCY1209]MEB3885700.1 hypothetical protein [Lyngbya sp. CCY1209]